MRAEIEHSVNEIRKSLALLKQRMGWDTAAHRMEEFDAMSEDPSLWDKPERAQKLMRERQQLADAIAQFNSLDQVLSDNIELIELGELEQDDEIIADAEAAIKQLQDQAAKAQLEALLSGEADSNDTFVEINAGAGGTESCDWASMLARMYTRWAESKGYSVDIMSYSAGDEGRH